jgi:N-acetylglucosaminyldiphosphoundecaprenol N-acetyl-beta-D-mannosaminyltransferase
MHWKRRWPSLLEKITLVDSESDLENIMQQLCAPNQRQVLAFANAHAFNSVANSVEFYDAISSAHIILRDGSGMAILYRMLGIKPGLDLNGTDLIPKIIKRFNGAPIALFGTQDPYLSKAAALVGNILSKDSCITCCDGFQESQVYCDIADKIKPKLIILGMGMPKQELIAMKLMNLKSPCLIVCGGAIIDFFGEKVHRAPKWMRRIGVEWVYRLVLEPRRLFSRYFIGNPIFIWRTLSICFRPIPDSSSSSRARVD